MCFRLVCRRWAAAGKAVAPNAGKEKLSSGKVTRTSMLDIAASVARAEPLTKANTKEEVLKTLRKKSVLKALLEEDFSNWTKRKINTLIRAYEQSGHTDIEAIAKAKFKV